MKYLFIPSLLFTSACSYAQTTSGVIAYEETIHIDVSESELPPGLAALLPKETKFKKVLYFTPGATLFENAADNQDKETSEFGENDVRITMQQNAPDEKTYTDIANGSITEQKDLMGRMFLVSDSIKDSKWKLTGRQKKIMDYPCIEAISISGTDTVTAWYTASIPVSAGPSTINGLPGMILEANLGSQVHFIATHIDSHPPSGKINVPSKGKKIHAADFEKLMQEKQMEMQQQFGGEGNVIIQQVR